MADYLNSTAKRRAGPAPGRRVASERRRLTLGTVDRPAGLGAHKAGPPQDQTGLINFLKNSKIQDLVTNARDKTGDEETGPKQTYPPQTLAGTSLGAQAMPRASASSSAAKKRYGKITCHSSVTDDDVKTFFGDKPTVGETLETINKLGFGASCKKGLKPESPNQDSYSVVHAEGDFILMGVYDGHGIQGHHVSQFVKDLLPKLFLSDPNRVKDPKLALHESFIRCQNLILHSEKTQNLQSAMSGTTVTVMYVPLTPQHLTQDGKPKTGYIAHVGDSRAAIVRQVPGGRVVGTPLTEDHKPSTPAEKERIEANGGRVIFDGFYNHRVFARGQMYPGLNMSRALGDTVAHREAGLSGIPDVKQFEIPTDSLGITLCTDGVWEFINNEFAAATVVQNLKQNLPPSQAVQQACEELAQAAWKRWMDDSDNEISDDITATFLWLDKLKQ